MLSREEKLDRRFEFAAICSKKIKSTFFGGAEKRAGRTAGKFAEKGGRIIAGELAETKERFQPFLEQEAGLSLQRQQAISGALGPEAQAQAFQEFQESPGTQFLREQGLRFINTGAAATGGLGGGERLRELTRFSQGLALQDLGGQFSRLGTTAAGEEAVIARRQQAAATVGGLAGQAALGQAGQLTAAGEFRAAGIVGQAAGERAGLSQLAGVFKPAPGP